MKRFRFWLPDGTTFDGQGREAFLAGPKHVVCVAQEDHYPPCGDYYWMDAEGLINHSITPRALYRCLKGELGIPLAIDVEFNLEMMPEVKVGVQVGHTEWMRIQREAAAWSQGGGCSDCG